MSVASSVQRAFRLIVAYILLSCIQFAHGAAVSLAASHMRIHIINVGQGSATLLEFKCGAILVDTGAAASTNPDSLTAYLDHFFHLRPDLHKTLDAVFLTHCHADHAYGLESLAERYTVKRYIDDGIRSGSGKKYVDAFLKYVDQHATGTIIRAVPDTDVRAVPNHKGLTDSDIDPLHSSDCDPVIRVLSGGLSSKPSGWSDDDFKNLNNDSLVIRVELGRASVLITGDLENKAIDRLTNYYANDPILDVDVLVVGHHGSKNGETQTLVNDVSPQIALISCGKWNDGKKTPNNAFTTWRYGHPNKGIVEMLEDEVAKHRQAKAVKVGLNPKQFVTLTVKKGVYCTGWDGDIVVDEDANGVIKVRTHGING